MTAHLPALQVVIPLLAAPLCVLLRSRTIAWLLFLAAAVAALVCASVLAWQVADGEVIHYAMGGWEPPAGIEYVIDRANVPVLILVAAIGVAAAVYCRASIAAEIEASRIPLFYACLCLNLTGLLGITATGDAFNAFVFLEITSLSSYALVAMGRRRRALLAAFQYLIVGTIGATFVLIGIGLAYAVTGTLNMADLAQRLPDIYGNRALGAAVIFVFVGLAIKMALFPLHGWLPGAYAESPSAVSVFLSATNTKVAIYLLLRFAFGVFGAALVFGRMPITEVGLVLACLAMLVASAVACFQSDFKYLLAWSSIAQVGYIVAGFSLATSDGVTAAYLHVINHAVIKGALFAAAGIVVLRLGAARLSDMAGMGRTMPWTFAAIVLAGLGLVGVPPTAGFVSKWVLAEALIADGRWAVLAVLLVSSLLSLVYVGRVIEAGWFRRHSESVAVERPPLTMSAAMWALVLVSLVFGLVPEWPLSLAEGASSVLVGVAK
ncbi:monovalent cation/H+ antiporter subunit D family protein [Actinomadura livida]|uniref:Monovalent cation/H+ antiporter subunit D family protein n=1 Tax=Actinomadura livida TaxID=79909 RepID=A0A7W7I7U8_9ACTN|nr:MULTISPECIES: monovalent cation/H+ antiporter subunit D family protein [Actinomadura]MBB4772065.1 multicomponent Na+:H+ antiporter subunit D [Actinomadura catellatispora]GGU04447.1 cation:proton antiporter [Actinomadura livida]